MIRLVLFLLLVPVTGRAALNVAATTPALAAIAREVGGEGTSVTSLSSSRQDPHHVDARPSLVLVLSRADLLLVNGLDLEVGWLPPLLTASRNPDVRPGARGYLDASQLVRRLDVPAAKVDRSMGDVHPGGNPHFTYDPRAGAVIARALGDRLAELDPERAGRYRDRARTLAARLESLAAEQRARLDGVPAARRKLVAYHRSLTYLLDWLGLTEVATLEPKPGIPPDPAHVAGVLRTMRASGTGVIVQEEYHPSRTARTLAELAKARVVILQGGPRFEEGQTYLEWLKDMAERIHGAL